MGSFRQEILLITIFAAFTFSLTGQNKPAYDVRLLDINSPVFSDISPVIVADGIVFCSTRRNSIIRDYSTWEGERLYNLYFSEKKENGDFKSPRLFSKDISSLFNEGPLCFTPDGNQVYFTRNIETGKSVRKKNRNNSTGIFIADKQGNSWVNIRPFPHNDPSFNIGHPTISADGNLLYFSSNKPGGSGEYDIYYCTLVDNNWSEPVNAGSKINTRYSEIFPGFHSSGRLYFSSNRPPVRKGEYGGLDIYYSITVDGVWSDPVLLAEPINSAADDYAFAAYPDGQSGFFTSSRQKENDNLYSFVSVIIRKEDCLQMEENYFCYEFYEENAVKYDTIPFQYEWDFGDGSKSLGVRAEHCFAGPGTYIVSLNALNLVTNEVQFNEVSYRLEISLVEQPYITGPDTCYVGEPVQMTASETHLPGWNIGRYYWNFGDETIAEGKVVTKTFEQTGVYEMQLIVSTEPDRNGVVQESCVLKRIVVLRR
jgi:hypothetical protein